VASSRQEREARAARDRLKRYTARQQVHERQTKRRFRDNLIAIIGVVVIAALAAATQIFFFTAGPGRPIPKPSASASESSSLQNLGAPDPTLSEYRTWSGSISLNGIPLSITLDGLDAPQATAGFVRDAESGYYVGKTCHRMADSANFSFIQCGSLDGTGAPDPAFHYGPIENAPADGIYPAGTIAMARAAGDGYSNGHQFFVVTADTTLNADAAGGYTVVGHVTSGLADLVAQIISAGVDPSTLGSDGISGSPVVPTEITAVTVQ
jgi:peptidyl-prolyl cis-trans isomerase B (cyclophilin B)